MTDVGKFWIKSALKTRRGWTDHFIEALLGEPDDIRPVANSTHKKMHCYNHDRVLAAESSATFQQHMRQKEIERKIKSSRKEITSMDRVAAKAEHILNDRLDKKFLAGHRETVEWATNLHNEIQAESRETRSQEDFTTVDKHTAVDQMLRHVIAMHDETHQLLHQFVKTQERLESEYIRSGNSAIVRSAMEEALYQHPAA